MTARRPLARGAAAVLLALIATLALPAHAAESGPAWAGLNPAQQQALAPLQRDWSTLDAARKQKWLEVAGRFPRMPADERRRVQERMAEWARMTPAERANARLQFQEARQLPPSERQAQWQAYQALPADERAALAQRATSTPPRVAGSVLSTKSAPASADAAATTTPVATGKAAARGNGETSGKRNLVVAAPSPATRAVAPTVIQAKPGATTTTMATKAAPPAHHQAGLPKIAATPGFVDPATLLPQRGPQGAAQRAAPAASAPARADAQP